MTNLMSQHLATFGGAGVGADATLAVLGDTTAAPAAHADSYAINASKWQLLVNANPQATVNLAVNGSNIGGEGSSTLGASGQSSGSIAGRTVDFIITWNPESGGGRTPF